ncbi:hypothetical protein GPOL_c04900 [Gordonia polyisoprenivorans VH2]|uniref:Lipoprotein n=1 Tax=Gordonia polyisoprenivorans (strain DSM 44266 / VH2) TaxID=1112204 RepID=H6MU83_GORPV|nr:MULTISPECIES: hypothetical protein [Gordonia]AFA71560.1 hypothetical protein GPOL_c04900 [Gordonia polyisoprenivorans VH2]MDF3282968.1 hypothetical protein [Gordonia sp. N1V]OPX10757.1 hypothetical protein B1964_23180 [Gordonia sp. i37]OZC33453.1 hypothetical protein CJJ17_19615 [Gordonia polyisoprenivorans]
MSRRGSRTRARLIGTTGALLILIGITACDFDAGVPRLKSIDADEMATALDDEELRLVDGWAFGQAFQQDNAFVGKPNVYARYDGAPDTIETTRNHPPGPTYSAFSPTTCDSVAGESVRHKNLGFSCVPGLRLFESHRGTPGDLQSVTALILGDGVSAHLYVNIEGT